MQFDLPSHHKYQKQKFMFDNSIHAWIWPENECYHFKLSLAQTRHHKSSLFIILFYFFSRVVLGEEGEIGNKKV